MKSYLIGLSITVVGALIAFYVWDKMKNNKKTTTTAVTTA